MSLQENLTLLQDESEPQQVWFGYLLNAALASNKNLQKLIFTQGSFSDILQHREILLQQKPTTMRYQQHLTHLVFQQCEMHIDLLPLCHTYC